MSGLKTLFNIVEAPLKKKNFDVPVLNDDVQIRKFWHSCCHFQDIYDWISPLNKPSGLPFIQTQQSMGRNE